MTAIIISRRRQKMVNIYAKKSQLKRVGGNMHNTFYSITFPGEKALFSSVREFAFLMPFENRNESNCLL